MLLVFLVPAHGADAPVSGEDRLRAALRDASLQLRDAQAQLATAQAAQAALTDENKALTQKYEALKKQVVADRAVTDKSLADATAQATEQKSAIARLTESLAKAKEEGEKSAAAAKAAEVEGARLKAENIALERRAADRQAKNLALFLLGNEILTRYEEFSLGNALKAKEPFVGVTRTRLENLVQDYQDKLLDARAKP
jgi:chromosome segregation ATPase